MTKPKPTAERTMAYAEVIVFAEGLADAIDRGCRKYPRQAFNMHMQGNSACLLTTARDGSGGFNTRAVDHLLGGCSPLRCCACGLELYGVEHVLIHLNDMHRVRRQAVAVALRKAAREMRLEGP